MAAIARILDSSEKGLVLAAKHNERDLRKGEGEEGKQGIADGSTSRRCGKEEISKLRIQSSLCPWKGEGGEEKRKMHHGGDPHLSKNRRSTSVVQYGQREKKKGEGWVYGNRPARDKVLLILIERGRKRKEKRKEKWKFAHECSQTAIGYFSLLLGLPHARGGGGGGGEKKKKEKKEGKKK